MPSDAPENTPPAPFSAAYWDADIQRQVAIVNQLEGLVTASELYQQLQRERGALAYMQKCHDLAAQIEQQASKEE